MRASLVRSTLSMAGLSLILLLVLGQGVPSIPAASGQTRGAAPCAAPGTYTIPLRRLPLPQPGASRSYPAFGSVLAGTLTLRSYSGCGIPTDGSFAVYSVPRALLQTGIPAPPGPAVLPDAATTVLTATGTFAQDPGHAGDAGYVLVSATLTYGRYAAGCSAVCAPGRGQDDAVCRDDSCGGRSPTVSRIATFTAVTGFLRWQAGAPATLALLFLPPPSPAAGNGALSSQPLSLLARRTAS